MSSQHRKERNPNLKIPKNPDFLIRHLASVFVTLARAPPDPRDPGYDEVFRGTMSIASTTVVSLGARTTARVGNPRRSTKTTARSAVGNKQISLRVSPTTRRTFTGHRTGLTRAACKSDDVHDEKFDGKSFDTPRSSSSFDFGIQSKPSTESRPWWRLIADCAAAPALALVIAVATIATPLDALAATGGRMGGSAFRSSSMSRPMSSMSHGSSGFSSSRGLATSAVLIPMGVPMGGGMYYGSGGLFSAIFGVMVILAFLDAIKNALGGNDSGLRLGADRIAVVKIQIGLLGLARQLQLDLEDIADNADTSTTEGLHYVLEETVLALLRNPEYCVYGYATSAAADGPADAEDRFNEFSMDERGKFEEETLVNVNNRKKASEMSKNSGSSEKFNEYILVTIIAACDGGLKLPAVNDSAELKTALKRVGAIRVDALQAVEVLWTPQEEDDTLSEDELLTDYPQLNIL